MTKLALKRKHWRGKTLLGGFYELTTGGECFLAHRRQADIERQGARSISEAIRESLAAWALEDDVLIMLRAKGITTVGVLVRETEDIYMTDLENFFDRGKSRQANFRGRDHRLLPLHYFRREAGAVRV